MATPRTMSLKQEVKHEPIDSRASSKNPVAQAPMARAALVCTVVLAIAPGCGLDADPAEPETSIETSALVQSCRATNVQGAPYDGIVCGGSVIDGCSKGMLYSCQRATGNNCTLSQTCATACLTGPNSTPVTVNTSTPHASDACFTGAAPLALSTTTPRGGDNVTMTATLQQAHSPYAVVNLTGTTPEVPPLCNVPVLLMAGATTVMISVLLGSSSPTNLRGRGPAVGLFADQEIRLIQGPLFVDHPYELEREIIALSESPRTESAWIRTRVFDAGTRTPVAEMILNHAVMKASYAAYDREAAELGRGA